GRVAEPLKQRWTREVRVDRVEPMSLGIPESVSQIEEDKAPRRKPFGQLGEQRRLRSVLTLEPCLQQEQLAPLQRTLSAPQDAKLAPLRVHLHEYRERE